MDATSAAGWAGIVMAAIALAGTVYNQFNARAAQRDKLEFELKTRELELQAQAGASRMASVERELAATRAELSACREQHRESEADRQHLWAELESLKKGQVKP